MTKTLLLALALTVAARTAAADAPRISPETDPSLFLLNGYGFSVGASVAPHWHLQVTQFASDLYDFATPKGFDARIDRGTFVWLRYYLRPDNAGLFVGAALDALDWRYTRSDTPGDVALDQEYAAMPFVGYRWFPTHRGFYVVPWVGLALPFNRTGDDTVGAMKYEAKFPVFPLAAVHLGWEFGR